MTKLTDESKLKCVQLREVLQDALNTMGGKPVEDINWHRVHENVTFAGLLTNGIMQEVKWR